MGRPTDFTDETANEICRRLMDGESLRRICADETMPARSAVHSWLATREDFADQYARAREFQADTLFDEIQDIADDGSNDFMGEDAKYNGDAVQRSKLRVDARKWMAGKLRPKKYGDRTILEGDADNPLIPAASDTDLARLIVFQLSRATRENGEP